MLAIVLFSGGVTGLNYTDMPPRRTITASGIENCFSYSDITIINGKSVELLNGNLSGLCEPDEFLCGYYMWMGDYPASEGVLYSFGVDCGGCYDDSSIMYSIFYNYFGETRMVFVRQITFSDTASCLSACCSGVGNISNKLKSTDCVFPEVVGKGGSINDTAIGGKCEACGNGVLDPGEQCDGTNLSGKSCLDFGYSSGNLTCLNCSFNVSNCTKVVPSLCTLTSAYWNTTKAKEGEKVKLIVNGTNCNGFNVSFVVKENDSINNIVSLQPVDAIFINNQSITNWTAEWLNDSDEGGDNNPEYYFNASLVLNLSKSIISGKVDSKLLHVNKTIIPSTGTITAMYWENIIGEKINKSGLRDSVYAVVVGLSSGQSVDYEIRKDVSLGDNIAKQGSFNSSGSGKDKIDWIAGYDNVDVNEYMQGIYHFRVSLDNKASWNSTKHGQDSYNAYGELNVSEENNNKPNASIISPKDKQIYFLNELLNFTAKIFDEDSVFSFVWEFGDGTSDSVNYNVTHAYNSTGQKNIKLTLIDGQGAISIDRISILIINSSYMLAYIDEPRWGISIVGMYVIFNATSTYAVNVTHNSSGIKKIECVAGPCPSKTEGCPPPYPANYPICQIPIPSTVQFPNPNWAGFENINFSWEFDGMPWKNKSGKGMAGAFFPLMFLESRQHTAVLKTNLNPSSETETLWFNMFSNSIYPGCLIDNSGVAYWLQSERFTKSFDSCYRVNVAPGSSNECCDDGYRCDILTGKCGATEINDCFMYTNADDCNNDLSNVATSSVESKTGNAGYCSGYSLANWEFNNGEKIVYCENVTGFCRCEWRNGNCTAKYNITTACSDNTILPVGTCEYTVSELGNCSAGFRLMRWIGLWVYGDKPAGISCDNGKKRAPCPAQLSFTSLIGLGIAIVLVILFYSLSRKKIGKVKKRGK